MIIDAYRYAASAPPIPPTPYTWNPADVGTGITLTDGDLTVTGTDPTVAWRNARSFKSSISGLRYFECLCVTKPANGYMNIGVGFSDTSLVHPVGDGTTGWSWQALSPGYRWHGGVFTNIGVNFTDGDVLGVAVDFDTGVMQYRKNGSLIDAPFAFTPSVALYPMVGVVTSGVWTAYFEVAEWVHPLSGYAAFGDP